MKLKKSDYSILQKEVKEVKQTIPIGSLVPSSKINSFELP